MLLESVHCLNVQSVIGEAVRIRGVPIAIVNVPLGVTVPPSLGGCATSTVTILFKLSIQFAIVPLSVVERLPMPAFTFCDSKEFASSPGTTYVDVECGVDWGGGLTHNCSRFVVFGSTNGRKSGAFAGLEAPWHSIQVFCWLIMLSTLSNSGDLQYCWAEFLGVEMARKTVITVN